MCIDSQIAALDRQVFTIQYTVNCLICCSSVLGMKRWSLYTGGWLLRQDLIYNCTKITQDVIELQENIVVYIYYTVHDERGRVNI